MERDSLLLYSSDQWPEKRIGLVSCQLLWDAVAVAVAFAAAAARGMTKVHSNQANGTQQVSRAVRRTQGTSKLIHDWWLVTGVSPVVLKSSLSWVAIAIPYYLHQCINFSQNKFRIHFLPFHLSSPVSFPQLLSSFLLSLSLSLFPLHSPIPFSVCLYIKSKKFRVSKVKRKWIKMREENQSARISRKSSKLLVFLSLSLTATHSKFFSCWRTRKVEIQHWLHLWSHPCCLTNPLASRQQQQKQANSQNTGRAGKDGEEEGEEGKNKIKVKVFPFSSNQTITTGTGECTGVARVE